MVVAARRWIELVERMGDSATLDIDGPTESLEDQIADHGVSNLPQKAQTQAANKLFNARVARARARIREAVAARAAIRKTLHLDDED